jgi:hypothetical protein
MIQQFLVRVKQKNQQWGKWIHDFATIGKEPPYHMLEIFQN